MPLALLGLLAYGMVTGGGVPSLEGLGAFLGFGLVGGYLAMGLQSAAFAFLMLWLERRRLPRARRCLVAAVLGCLFGATLAFAEDELFASVTLTFAVLGALVGPAAVLLADLLAAAPSARWARTRVARRRVAGQDVRSD